MKIKNQSCLTVLVSVAASTFFICQSVHAQYSQDWNAPNAQKNAVLGNGGGNNGGGNSGTSGAQRAYQEQVEAN